MPQNVRKTFKGSNTGKMEEYRIFSRKPERSQSVNKELGIFKIGSLNSARKVANIRKISSSNNNQSLNDVLNNIEKE